MTVHLTERSVQMVFQEATAEIYFHGATVTSWIYKKEPLLFLSPKAILDGSKAIRGGIPIVFPQFGQGPALPTMQHGFARSSTWKWLGVSTENEKQLTVRLGLESNEKTLSIWPHAFKLVLSVSLLQNGRHLSTELAVENTGSAPFTFTTLFHTYFQVHSQLRDVRVSGLKGLAYKDRPRKEALFQDHEDAVVFVEGQEVDRTYLQSLDRPLSLQGVGPNGLRVTTKNLQDTVVWNPGSAKAQTMGDLGDPAYLKMVCVEAGTVANDIQLEAGTTWVGSQTLSLV